MGLRSILTGGKIRNPGAVLGGFSLSPTWSLTKLEPVGRSVTVEGQFAAEQMSERGSTTWNRLGLPTRQRPLRQWVRGESTTFSFQTRFVNETVADDWLPAVRMMQSWKDPDIALGRPPKVMFVCGDVEFVGFIESFDVDYTEPHLTGQPRQIHISVTLSESGEDESSLIREKLALDRTKPPSLSRHVVVQEGATYETYARQEYGSALFGVLVRQDALVAFPEAGETIFLPDRSFYRARPLAPDAWALGDSDEARAARESLFDAHDGARQMPRL